MNLCGPAGACIPVASTHTDPNNLRTFERHAYIINIPTIIFQWNLPIQSPVQSVTCLDTKLQISFKSSSTVY